jgi:hypothetical protein
MIPLFFPAFRQKENNFHATSGKCGEIRIKKRTGPDRGLVDWLHEMGMSKVLENFLLVPLPEYNNVKRKDIRVGYSPILTTKIE